MIHSRDLLHRLPDLPLYNSMRLLGRPVIPPLELTLAVTSRCRKKCLTCNSWRRPAGDELSADDYRLLFSSLDYPFLAVTITGGEPFMRRDIEEIVVRVCEKNPPGLVRILTSGDAPKTAARAVKNLAARFPEVGFLVMISADTTGAFDSETSGGDPAPLLTWRGLEGAGFSNIIAGFTLLATCYNSASTVKMIENAFELQPDAVELRFACGSRELDVISTEVMPDLNSLDETLRAYRENLWKTGPRGRHRFFRRLFAMRAAASAASMNRMKRTRPCFAGCASLYIDPAGTVLECPVSGREMGALRESAFRLEPILRSAQAARVRREVRTSGCFCAPADSLIADSLMKQRGCISLLTTMI